jgi:hypothetical protein
LPVKGKLSAKESLASSSGMTSKKYQRGISKPKKQHSIIRPAKEKKLTDCIFYIPVMIKKYGGLLLTMQYMIVGRYCFII